MSNHDRILLNDNNQKMCHELNVCYIVVCPVVAIEEGVLYRTFSVHKRTILTVYLFFVSQIGARYNENMSIFNRSINI